MLHMVAITLLVLLAELAGVGVMTLVLGYLYNLKTK